MEGLLPDDAHQRYKVLLSVFLRASTNAPARDSNSLFCEKANPHDPIVPALALLQAGSSRYPALKTTSRSECSSAPRRTTGHSKPMC